MLTLSRVYCAVILGLIITAVACSKPNIRTFKQQEFVREGALCLVVPAFSNLTGSKNRTSDIVTDIVTSVLLADYGLDSIGRREVEKMLNLQNVTLPSPMTAATALWLGRMIGARAVLFGSVAEFAYGTSGELIVGDPKVAIHARLLNVTNGEVVWSGWARKSGEDYFEGKRDPLTRTALIAVQDLLKDGPFGEEKRSTKTINSSQSCELPEISMDIDKDGILNLADRCPLRKEDKNGYNDFDGCPDQLEGGEDFFKYFSIDGDRIVMKEPIKFKAKTDEILSESIPTVEGLAKFLSLNLQFKKIMIEGFARMKGGEESLERFGFLRADAVKKVLMRNGVEEPRLIAIGYGVKPKSKRRDVEFTIIE